MVHQNLDAKYDENQSAHQLSTLAKSCRDAGANRISNCAKHGRRGSNGDAGKWYRDAQERKGYSRCRRVNAGRKGRNRESEEVMARGRPGAFSIRSGLA